MAQARLAHTTVLPSSGPVEVTAMVLTFSSIDVKRILAKSVRDALFSAGIWN